MSKFFAVAAAALALSLLSPASAQSIAEPSTPPVASSAAPAATPPPAEAPPAEAAPGQPTPEQLAAAQAFYESLHRQTGLISIAGGKASLNVPETHYFLGAEDARRVIVDVWGNPPESATGVDGMIFLADVNPYSDTWGAIVQYSPEGHVADTEASTINYTDLLHNMQRDTQTQNEWRRQNNYPEIRLVDWAEPPHYDAATRKLYWAQALAFAGAPQATTVNYDIRVLGREGYLVISFVAAMAQLPQVRENAPPIMEMATFTPGNTYADYQPGTDRAAAYGIGGLIAGGALAAVAQKTGLLALILAFGKKFIILLVAAFAGLANWVRGLFGRKRDGDDGSGGDAAPGG